MKRLLLILLVACAGFAAAPHRAAADTCGVPEKGTIWVDFADGSVPFWQTFARPGVIAAAANFIYPPQLRAMGAKTVYFDLNFRLRVGTPLEPFDPAVVINRANRLYSTAAMSSGCTQPVIAENELNGANLVTPWTANNAQYRRNVLIYMQTLSALGARPVILVPSAPYMGDEAGDWWRQLTQYAEVVRESYFAAPGIAKQGPIEGSRTLRNMFRKRVAEFTSAGLPANKLGLMLGFQTTRGSGGREGASRNSWLEVTKLQALAAKQVASEVGLRSVWSWGWAAWSDGERDPDKPTAACVYLWARDQSLCNGPSLAGKGFNTSLTQGQLTLPSGTRCTLYGRPITESTISSLTPVTGDPDVAFTAAFARAVTSLQVPLKGKRVADAERAVVAARFGGSFARYGAALSKAHSSRDAALGVIGDELRRVAIESGFRVGGATATEINEYYDTYGSTRARLVQTKTAAPWLGNRKRGFALESMAPPQLFSLAGGGGWHSIRTMRGTYQVRALDSPVLLGALPLGVARPAIANALQELARSDRYEAWLLARERVLDEQAVCRRDAQPEVGVVQLTDYLPFLAAD
ncbi:MAG TPA: hypothetical protein VLK24_00115 [Gaiellaceae bacterium]|nr:hypothetical protein [Gaiellaceae bacterium]